MKLIQQLALALLPRVTRPAAPHQVRPVGAVKVDEAVSLTGELPRGGSAVLPPGLRPPPVQPPLSLPNPGHWRSTCMAVSYASGHQCRLLAGHEGEHRNERGSFTRALQPGERPQRRAALDEASTRRPGAT